jgi:DNA-binding transcriptional MerR regulator
MKQEFSQMAFNFPMEAEPKAPPQNGMSSRYGGSGHGLRLSEEEEHTVREEGRRAGVVVRIKSLKTAGLPVRPGPLPEPTPNPEPEIPNPEPIPEPDPLPRPEPAPPKPIQQKTPEKIFIQTTIPLEDIDLPIVMAEIQEPVASLSGPTGEMTAPTLPAPSNELPVSLEELPEALEELPLEEFPEPPLKRPASRRKLAPGEKSKPVPAGKVKSKRGRKSLKQITAEADLIEIPEDEVLFSKHYYTMGEVAEMFHVNQSLLRFWETEFGILQPRKNKKGDRYFRPIDIKNLHLIYHLLRQRKYTIEGAKEFLRQNKKADKRFEAIQRLQQIKAFLLELKAQL